LANFSHFWRIFYSKQFSNIKKTVFTNLSKFQKHTNNKNLKNVPKLIHSNSKFRVFATEAFRSEKSTETSDYLTEVSVKSTKHSSQIYSWPLGPLVSVVDFEPKKSWVQAPNTPEKKNKKSKIYQVIRNQNQIFHGFNPESTIETSGRNFARDFE
jgi:hypothetical protein